MRISLLVLMLFAMLGCSSETNPAKPSAESGGNQAQQAAKIPGSAQSNAKLTTCADCGGKVSKLAAACPHCGRPLSGTQAQPPPPANNSNSSTRSPLAEFGEAAFVAFKTNDMEAVYRLGADEALFRELRTKMSAAAKSDSERKEIESELNDERIQKSLDNWRGSVSGRFDRVRRDVDWHQAELVAVLDDEGRNPPDSKWAEFGMRDNVAVFVIFEVNTGLFVLRIKEVAKFGGRWFFNEDVMTVDPLAAWDQKYPGRSVPAEAIRYALAKYTGSERDRILRELSKVSK